MSPTYSVLVILAACLAVSTVPAAYAFVDITIDDVLDTSAALTWRNGPECTAEEAMELGITPRPGVHITTDCSGIIYQLYDPLGYRVDRNEFAGHQGTFRIDHEDSGSGRYILQITSRFAQGHDRDLPENNIYHAYHVRGEPAGSGNPQERLSSVGIHENTPPTFGTTTRDHTAAVNHEFTLNLRPVDDTRDDIVYVIIDGKGAMDGHEFKWTPGPDDSGETNNVRIRVHDGQLGISYFDMQITVPESRLSLRVDGERSVIEGGSFALQMNARDADDDESTWRYNLRNEPDGMTVDGNGRITWDPSDDQGPGRYTFTAVVSHPDDEARVRVTLTIVADPSGFQEPVLPAMFGTHTGVERIMDDGETIGYVSIHNYGSRDGRPHFMAFMLEAGTYRWALLDLDGNAVPRSNGNPDSRSSGTFTVEAGAIAEFDYDQVGAGTEYNTEYILRISDSDGNTLHNYNYRSPASDAPRSQYYMPWPDLSPRSDNVRYTILFKEPGTHNLGVSASSSPTEGSRIGTDTSVNSTGTFTTASGRVSGLSPDTQYYFHLTQAGQEFGDAGQVVVPFRTLVAGSETVGAVDDFFEINGSSDKTFDVLANDDIDPPSALDDVHIGAQGTKGMATVNADNTITYTTQTNEDTTDTFTYWLETENISTLDDAIDSNALATVTVEIQSRYINQPPTADDITLNVTAGQSVSEYLGRHIDDPERGNLTITIAEQGSKGTARIITESETFAYTANLNADGNDTVRYKVTDDHDLSDNGTVTIQIEPLEDNEPPRATSFSVTVGEDDNVSVNLFETNLASDPDGDELTIHITRQSDIGEAESGDNTVEYFSPPNSNGNTTDFEYTVYDGRGGNATGTVTVNIGATTEIIIIPIDDEVTVRRGMPHNINVTENDTIMPITTSVALRIIELPTKGTAEIVENTRLINYTANLTATGDDMFVYALGIDNDRNATVTIHINTTNQSPMAEDETLEIQEDSGISTVMPGISDLDGTATITAVGSAMHGETGFTSTTVTYRPNANYHGPDSFTYTVTDNMGATATGNVIVTVESVNDAPVIGPTMLPIDEDPTEAGTVTPTISDDGTFSITDVGNATHGTTGHTDTTVTYRPNLNYHGPDSFTYTVTDDEGLTATGSVSVTVRSINDAPTIERNETLNIPEDSETETVTPRISDIDGTATITAAGDATNGETGFTPTTVTYRPNPDYHGPDSFTYTVTDNEGGTAPGTVNITVTPVNDPPTISGLASMAINELAPLNIPVSLTDVDNATDQLTFTTEFMGEAGLPDGMELTRERLTWTPTEAQGPGEYPFTVRVSDELNQTTSEFTFTVNEVNQDPEFNITRTDHTATQGIEFTLNMNASDADLPEQEITCSITSQETGSVPAQINPQTCIITWTPADLGEHTISVRAVDDHSPTAGSTQVAVININVRFNDMEVPVITLNNATQNPQIIELGDGYEELGATVDDDDPSYMAEVDIDSSRVDINNTGTYTVTYTAPADPAGKTPEPVTRDVTVQDTTKPVIDITGLSDVNVVFGGEYDEQGAEVDDNDPDYAGTVTIHTPEIDSSMGGATYTVIYSAPADDAGNVPDNKTRTVTIDDEFADDNVDPVAQDATLNITEDSGEATVMPDINDPDNSGTLEIVSVSTPSKGEADFNSTDNTITYEPRENEHGLDMFNYTIGDNRGGTDTATIRVNITSVNDLPELEVIADREIDELVPFDIQLNATDVETDSGDLIWAHPGAPVGLAINATGYFSWTPTEEQGPGEYQFNITVSDGIDTDSQEVMFTVEEVNQNPVLEQEDVMATEDVPLAFQISATDSDIPVQSLTYAPETGTSLPHGAVLNRTGYFEWTPTEEQSGENHTITVRIEDGPGRTVGNFTIQVTAVNDPPALNMIANETVNEHGLLIIMLSANDTDNTPDELTYAAPGAPANLDITDNMLSWTPDEEQGGESYTFDITVSDGIDTDSQAVTFEVIETNENPVLDSIDDAQVVIGRLLNFTVTANDDDRPNQTLTYMLGSTPPAGATISTQGEFRWMPAAIPEGEYDITVIVSDGQGGNATDVFTVTVLLANAPPVLDTIADATINEHEVLAITLGANDTDHDADQLTYDAPDAPAELDITGNSLTWTPTEEQGGRNYTFDITVSDGIDTDSQTVTFEVIETNLNPAFGLINDTSIEAGMTLVIDATAADGDIPAQALTHALVDPVPAGASITTAGIFTWETTAGQAGRNYTITVMVEDDAGGSDMTTFTVTVQGGVAGGPNQNPAAPDILINAELFFPSAVTPAVTDPDGDDITITRVTEPALGILDTSMLPQISYTPSQTGIDRLNYTATDNRGGTDTGTITIFINPEGNARPELDHIYNVGGRVGVDLEFTATADDSDDTSFTFDIANAPDGASITPGGDFSWRPASSQNGTHTVTFIVYDDSGGADWQHVLVTILRADETNLPPVPQDIDAGVVLGGGRGFQPNVSDPEGDMTEITRVYDSSLGDVDRSFTSQGIIVYIAGVLGSDEVIYTVSDGRGGFANGTISITVEEPANVRPLIEFVGDKSVNAGDELTFTVDADDLDGFVIDFGLEGDTQGPSMSPLGVFSWTPTANDVGRHEFTILVFDDAGDNSTVSIIVTVRPEGYRNSPPVAPDVVIMTPQDVLSIVRPTLTDPDEGDPVRITQTGDTTKGSILSGFLRAGIIIYLPNQGETGTETITYTVSDSSDDTDTATINVFISARGNTDPILGSIYFRNINAGDPLAFDLEAEDPDGDTISYQTVGAPDGIEISPQGAFSWTPTAADVGNHTFTVIAYDDRGGADSKTAVIRVLPAGTANQAPNAPDSTVTVAPGGSVVITPEISDPDGDRVTIDDAIADGTGVVIPSEDSINYIHIATTPTETITYTVTDARGATSTGTITVTVQ